MQYPWPIHANQSSFLNCFCRHCIAFSWVGVSLFCSFSDFSLEAFDSRSLLAFFSYQFLATLSSSSFFFCADSSSSSRAFFYSSHCMFLFCSLLHQKHLYLFEAWSKEESNSSLICKSATSIFFADSELWVSLSALKLIPWRLGARTSLLRENPQMKKTGWMRNSSLKEHYCYPTEQNCDK